jgi:glutathione S-transferase
MQLIGYLDSPYVRRVAITMQCLGIPCEHRELSIWRDYEEFRGISPLVKVPTLVCDDGHVLVDSALIIDFLESQAAGGRSLMPDQPEARRDALQCLGTALIAMEKSVQLIYEKQHRPPELQHAAWISRLEQQLEGAVRLMESAAQAADLAGLPWLISRDLSQADITTAVAWRFMQHTSAVGIDPSIYPALSAFSQKAESLPEFRSCPLSE